MTDKKYMNQMIASIIALLIGTVITVNGVVVKSDDLIASAQTAVNGANFHQIVTILELYYSDHNSYPDVSGGEALIDLFEKEGYIRNRPIDPNVFDYQSKNGGQDYALKVAAE